MNKEQTQQLAVDVLTTEANAVLALRQRIDDDFLRACDMLLSCSGRVVVCGVGKSGHIAGKIAATLASTGTAAFFVHPAEASHGDLGMIRADDIVIAISHSGETSELMVILPVLQRIGCQMISITGKPASTLARSATVNLNVAVDHEACPLGLAPTSSTTATLAMGDALAVAVLQTRGFNEEDFAFSHPGGSLGKRLLLRVSDVMVSGDDIPLVGADMPLKEALVEMSAKQLGLLLICDADQKHLGVFTDGDLRRSLDHDINIYDTTIGDVMTRGGQTIAPDRMAVDALNLMQQRKIMALPVVEADGSITGALNMHSLFRAGVV